MERLLIVHRKQAVSSQSQELEALEAKLKETEERLKEKQSSPVAKRRDETGYQQQPLPANHGSQNQDDAMTSYAPSNEPAMESTSDQRPSPSTMSYWRPQMPGALPETPSESRQNSYIARGSKDT